MDVYREPQFGSDFWVQSQKIWASVAALHRATAEDY